MNDMIETTALVVYRELPPTLTDVYIQQGGVDAVLALIERQADELRAANLAHRAGINREVLAAIMLAMSEAHTGNAEEADAIGKAIVTAIAKGAVPHTTINY